ncbi:EthD family reductase [Neobacillus rhizophilus]|uniref:EthD family reductase n=1 Tax=Neobacillus rhizophilus TaxID=2833579 RepID=A0A942YVT3_9BACI|nr:EthD family reductase [Neobacillus rhizophilus]MBS4214424.1 EthD family reductase [Neobacillus rhizophilus]MBU8918314.1 EthD family reductase [Bacillus sp. FJAT-29953]
MAKMIIMYEQPIDKEAFDQHYFNVHVPLGKKIPNILRESVRYVLQTQNTDLNLYLITELEFESVDTLTQALASPEAKAAEEDGPNLMRFLKKPPIITIVE